MLAQFTNNAASTLAANIGSAALSLTVATGDGAKFPTLTGGQYFYLTLCKVASGIEYAWEIVKVTARASDVFTIVRAQDGTTALSYVIGDVASLRVTAGQINTLLSTEVIVSVPQGGTGAATLTGLVKGNGTGAMTAATVRTDYAEPTTALATGLLKNTTTTGAHTIAVAGTDYSHPTAVETFTGQKTVAGIFAFKGTSTGVTYFQSGNASATDYTVTLPPVTDTLVTLAATQTLTNKTLTLPAVNGYTEGIVTANSTTAYTFSLASATVFLITLTGNVTYTFPTAVAGKSFTLYQLQDATGSRTVTWPGTVKWPAATAPTITSTASKADKFVFTCFDGSTWCGSLSGSNY